MTNGPRSVVSYLEADLVGAGIKADILDLNAVFGQDIRYLVPLYQRPKLWNISQHWEPLWNDVRTLAEQIESLSPTGTPPLTRGRQILLAAQAR